VPAAERRVFRVTGDEQNLEIPAGEARRLGEGVAQSPDE
jgi:hypothetical protein